MFLKTRSKLLKRGNTEHKNMLHKNINISALRKETFTPFGETSANKTSFLPVHIDSLVNLTSWRQLHCVCTEYTLKYFHVVFWINFLSFQKPNFFALSVPFESGTPKKFFFADFPRWKESFIEAWSGCWHPGSHGTQKWEEIRTP